MWLLLVWLGTASAAEPLDLNQSSAEQLSALQGVGPARAEAIVRWRDTHGPFRTIDQLAQLPSMGRATVRALRPHIVIHLVDAPEQTVTPTRVSINSASAQQLAQMPGVDPRLATKMYEDRERNGPFASCQDLGRIEGVGVATLAVLTPHCQPH